MKNFVKAALVSLTFVLAASSAVAGTPLSSTASASAPAASLPGVSGANVPKALQMAVRGGVKVEKSFNAVDGLTGWVITQKDGQVAVLFSTADGKYLMAGALVNEEGKNLTAYYTEMYTPHPDFSKLENSAYLVEGAKSPKTIVYAFMDPNCIFCHLEWKALQAYEKVGLQVRWIPVAFLKPTSQGMAAALLESKQPAELLTVLQTKFDVKNEAGGIEPLAVVSAGSKAKIAANSELMHAFGFNGTPGMIYKDSTGKVQYHPGMIKVSELPGMFDLPVQINTDPELARFQ